MTVKCKICSNEYSAVNNLNKHVRKKHPDVLIEVSKVNYFYMFHTSILVHS